MNNVSNIETKRAYAEYKQRLAVLEILDSVMAKDIDDSCGPVETMIIEALHGNTPEGNAQMILGLWNHVESYADGSMFLTKDKDKEFSFGCDMCGYCCRRGEGHGDIIVHINELLNIARKLNISLIDAVMNYMDVDLGHTSKFPVTVLTNYSNGSLAGPARCVFIMTKPESEVKPGGSSTKLVQVCGVNDVKPATCAMFPIGRVQEIDPNDLDKTPETTFIVQTSTCQSDCSSRTSVSINEFFKGTSLDLHDLTKNETHKLLSSYQKHITPIIERIESKKVRNSIVYDVVKEAMILITYSWQPDHNITNEVYLNTLAEKFEFMGRPKGMLNSAVEFYFDVEEGINSGKYPLEAIEFATHPFTINMKTFCNSLLISRDEDVEQVFKVMYAKLAPLEIAEANRVPFTEDMGLKKMQELRDNGKLDPIAAGILQVMESVEGLKEKLNDPKISEEDKKSLLRDAMASHMPGFNHLS